MTATPHSSDGVPPTSGSPPVELLKWILDNNGRATWALAYTLVVVGGVLAGVWLLGPTAVNVVFSSLLGGGAGVGGAVLANRRRPQRPRK